MYTHTHTSNVDVCVVSDFGVVFEIGRLHDSH